MYESHDPVQGVAILTLPSGKKFDHLGIKIQFIGRIDMVRILVNFVIFGFELSVRACVWDRGYIVLTFLMLYTVYNRLMEFMKDVLIMISFQSPKNYCLLVPCFNQPQRFHFSFKTWIKNMNPIVVVMFPSGTFFLLELYCYVYRSKCAVYLTQAGMVFIYIYCVCVHIYR